LSIEIYLTLCRDIDFVLFEYVEASGNDIFRHIYSPYRGILACLESDIIEAFFYAFTKIKTFAL
jgi:hypothetical protein